MANAKVWPLLFSGFGSALYVNRKLGRALFYARLFLLSSSGSSLDLSFSFGLSR